MRNQTFVTRLLGNTSLSLAIFAALLLLAAALSSCEKQQYDYPQTLRYEVIGNSFYVSYYDKNSTVNYPYSLPNHVPVNGETYFSVELDGMNPGDSINILVMDSKTPWDTTHTDVRVYLGDCLLSKGSTKETGTWMLRGKLSLQDFSK